MKQIILLLSTIFAFLTFNSCSSSQTAAEKYAEGIIDSLNYVYAKNALLDTNFLIQADRISLGSGYTSYVNERNTNFIYAHNGKATIQLASTRGHFGLNGLGGITVEGTVGGFSSKVDKKGNVTIDFGVSGVGISARVNISLPYKATKATATIYPNFRSNSISLFGPITPFDNSKIFEGRKL